jgi:hypothetical protein
MAAWLCKCCLACYWSKPRTASVLYIMLLCCHYQHFTTELCPFKCGVKSYRCEAVCVKENLEACSAGVCKQTRTRTRSISKSLNPQAVKPLIRVANQISMSSIIRLCHVKLCAKKCDAILLLYDSDRIEPCFKYLSLDTRMLGTSCFWGLNTSHLFHLLQVHAKTTSTSYLKLVPRTLNNWLATYTLTATC